MEQPMSFLAVIASSAFLFFEMVSGLFPLSRARIIALLCGKPRFLFQKSGAPAAVFLNRKNAPDLKADQGIYRALPGAL
jgi:hypothetical protein